MTTELIRWSQIKSEIANAKDIIHLSKLSVGLEAIEKWSRQSGQSLETQNEVAEYRLRLDRKRGQWVEQNIPEDGGNPTDQLAKNGRLLVPTLKAAGIGHHESPILRKLAAISEEKFEKIIGDPKKKKDELTRKLAISVIKKEIRNPKIEEEKQARQKVVSTLDIRNGDFNEVLADLKEIDAIITDPPYPQKYLKCFSELSEFASEKLKKDGFIAVYSGQFHLPEVIQRLSEHLTYVWTFCLYHVGKKQLVNGVNIMCGWKPVLIFSRGNKKMRFSAYDVLISQEREKENHEWQQSETGVKSLIEILSRPGELVVDPFSGSATFLKVANELGRRTVGAEIV